MHETIRLLAIVPYGGMVPLLHEVATEFPQLQVEPILDKSRLFSSMREEDLNQYDLILKAEETSIQAGDAIVMNLEHSAMDLITTFNYAAANTAIAAILGTTRTEKVYRTLTQLFPFDATFYNTDLIPLPLLFQQLEENHVRTVICDASIYNEAKNHGLDAFLLFYGTESIRFCLSKATELVETARKLHHDNAVLRQLLKGNPELYSVVYSAEGILDTHLSSSEMIPLDSFLKDQLPQFSYQDAFRLVHRQGGFLYHIQANRMLIGDETYYVFFLNRTSPSARENRGITYFTPEEIRTDLETSVFGIARIESYYSSEIQHLSTKKDPILISGEIGIGKDHMAKTIYTRSAVSHRPFIIINCPQMDERTWNYLLKKEDSPLYDTGNTLFFQNIDALTYNQNMDLLNVLTDSKSVTSNRIILSCSEQRTMTPVKNQQILKTINRLHCQVLFMIPLRGQETILRNSVRYLLEDPTKEYAFSPSGLQPQAFQELLHYNWPQNFEQLKRVMDKLAVAAGDGLITFRHVEDVLRSEINLVQGETGQTTNTILDLTQSLAQINRDIVQIVLEQTNGNQTEAAQRLGIGRSTLWRMINRKEET